MKKITNWKNKTAKKKHLEALIKDSNQIAILYNKDQNHYVGDYISHFKFGLGFIQKIINHTKMEVFFERSEKILLQNFRQI